MILSVMEKMELEWVYQLPLMHCQELLMGW